MIVLWGLLDDSPLRLVLEALGRLGAPHLFLNHADVLDMDLEVEVDARPHGVLSVGGQRIPLDQIHAFYPRPYDFRQYPAFVDLDEDSAEYRHAATFEDMMWGLAATMDALVLNRPSAVQSNGSKPFQARLIAAAGFEVPETLITTDAAAVRDFMDRHGAVVYKSISGSRSIVGALGPDHEDRFSDVRWCPTQFQRLVEGQDYRVHVVAERAFATRIVSDAVDYRYGGARYEAVDVPDDLPRAVAQRCIDLTRALGLSLAGIDLRHTPDDRWICFEANPSPAYSCYESVTGQPISMAIAELLVQADCQAAAACARGTWRDWPATPRARGNACNHALT